MPVTFVKQSLKAPAYRSALATKDMCVSDVSLWLGLSDIDSVPFHRAADKAGRSPWGDSTGP